MSTLTLKKDSTTTATYSYTYDSLGNILTVSKDGSRIYSYEYDSLNQLTREDDVAQGTSTLFDYDLSGNITARHIFPYWAGCPTSQLRTLIGIDQYCTTISYGYSTGAWGDMLTSYDGTTISYDMIGNPANWRGMVGLSWNGRQLAGIEIDGISEELTFRYNADGIRTKKTYYDVNGYLTSHKYILDGNKIVKETVTGNSAYTLYYLYDAAGSIAGLEYNGTTYYFQKNLQGDIIRICNIAGNTVVEYTYDAWGKVLSVTGSLASTVGQANPFRYRGYYYDIETGLYYLQTRYYDPEVGRFLNADGYIGANGDIPSYNMFAYCSNNPVNNLDSNGRYWTRADIVREMLEGAGGGVCGGSGVGVPILCGGGSITGGGGLILGTGGLILGGVSIGGLLDDIWEIIRSFFKPKTKVIDDVTVDTETKDTTRTKPTLPQKYYHVTTKENAEKIINSLLLKGSDWEAGHVFAWRLPPNEYAIKNSGAHFGVIIEFETYAPFVPDTGIKDKRVLIFQPVVSLMPGPIIIISARIYGITD